MRKVFAILLISLLSLQASWAAAASYCRHEQGAAVRHFGHHEHLHDRQLAAKAGTIDAVSAAGQIAEAGHATDVADAAGGMAGVAGADLDCGVCHAHALFGVPSSPAPSVPDAPAVATDTRARHPLPSVPQPRPERPDWRVA